MKPPIPTENEECEVFADYLNLKHYHFSHIGSELKTKNWGAIMRSKKLGLKPGLPDYIIVSKKKQLIFIEMKRIKNSKVSTEQQGWIDNLRLCKGVYAAVCYGCEDAIRFLNQIETFENIDKK